MRLPRAVECLLPTLCVGIIFYQFYYSIAPSSLMVKVPLSTMSIPLSHSEYKVVEMNNRRPFFKLATVDGQKPYADGDRAQEAVVNSLQLVDQCKRDPSFIVVDVGAFLGTYDSFRATEKVSDVVESYWKETLDAVAARIHQ